MSEPKQSMLTAEQRRELERRIAEEDANPNDAIPWEEVKARALAAVKEVSDRRREGR